MANKNIPVLVLNNLVLFPSTEITVEIDKTIEYQVIEYADKYFNGELLIVNKYDNLEDAIDFNNFLEIGVSSRIIRKMDLPNGKVRLTITGINRVRIDNYYTEDNILHAKYSNLLLDEIDPKNEIAYIRMINKMVNEYIENVPYSSNAIINVIKDINKLDTLTDVVITYFDFSYERKKEYLLETNIEIRATMLMNDIKQDFKIVDLERQIDEKLNNRLEENQKEFVLREKIKVIKEELGDISDRDTEIEEIKEKLNSGNYPDNIVKKVYSEIKKYESYPSFSPESGVIKNYIDLVLNLPWNRLDKREINIDDVENKLNESHYGLEDVKTRILDYLAVKDLSKSDKSPIICLVGPPGVGKTTLAISIAKAMDREYAKISVGGVDDQAEIVGHRRTYIGSMPGMIINGIKKCGISNPVFIIDEIDKMSRNIKGDPISSLLEVLDKEQNNKFVDHFVEEEYDLSKVMFITTANYIENIPNELYDRLEIIELNTYSKYEKINIAKDYLIPKLNDEFQVNFKFNEDTISFIIDNYTREAGVRELDRKINTIFRKIIRKNKNNKEVDVKIENVKKYLGIYIDLDNTSKKDAIGVVNGLSYTPYGGDTLRIEGTMFEGKDQVVLTGSLGEVMKESCVIAVDYIKSNYNKFSINSSYFDNKTLHLHFPEGAIKKEGPSAGIAITTVILSCLLNKKIPCDMAMTGEITLRGDIIPIGGVKEKVIGAKNRNIKKIFLPKENKKDVEKLDKEIIEGITFIYVNNYMDVFNKLFKTKRVKTEDFEPIKLNI